MAVIHVMGNVLKFVEFPGSAENKQGAKRIPMHSNGVPSFKHDSQKGAWVMDA